MKASAVEFRSVTKRYGDVVAVDSVSFTVEAGTLVTLLGPSGCGKTTTLRMIAGLELASEGEIHIGERDVTRLPATDRDVSMVFQSYALFPHMDVIENVSYGLAVRGGLAGPAARAKAEEGLATVGLEGFGARLPSELSGGQQQRVAVARALVLEPQVLLFDEPLSNLDARLRRQMREEIRRLQQALGFTAVYVTHDQDEALAVSDRIIVMDRSVIVQEGSPRELYDAPLSVFVAEFMGEANVLEGTVESSAEGAARVRLGPLALDVPLAAGANPEPGPSPVAVRPHAVRLEALEGEEGEGVLAGQLATAMYLGDHMEYEVETPLGGLFVVRPETASPLVAGSKVSITFDPDGVRLVRP